MIHHSVLLHKQGSYHALCFRIHAELLTLNVHKACMWVHCLMTNHPLRRVLSFALRTSRFPFEMIVPTLQERSMFLASYGHLGCDTLEANSRVVVPETMNLPGLLDEFLCGIFAWLGEPAFSASCLSVDMVSRRLRKHAVLSTNNGNRHRHTFELCVGIIIGVAMCLLNSLEPLSLAKG